MVVGTHNHMGMVGMVMEIPHIGATTLQKDKGKIMERGMENRILFQMEKAKVKGRGPIKEAFPQRGPRVKTQGVRAPQWPKGGTRVPNREATAIRPGNLVVEAGFPSFIQMYKIFPLLMSYRMVSRPLWQPTN